VHRNLPVRIPDSATFAFDFITNTVVFTAGRNLYVPVPPATTPRIILWLPFYREFL
jgi:hypothetical protein